MSEDNDYEKRYFWGLVENNNVTILNIPTRTVRMRVRKTHTFKDKIKRNGNIKGNN